MANLAGAPLTFSMVMPSGCEVGFERCASPKDGEGEALPLCRKLWCEVQLLVANLHAAEPLHHRHPCSCHRSDVQPFVNLAVVIVDVQTRGAQIHFVGFLWVINLCSKNSVHTWTQRALMNGLRLIEVEIALYFFFLVEVVQEVVALQHVLLA